MNRSLQSRLTFWISATILAIGLPAGIISFVSAFEEANDLQDDHLRQVASLIDSNSLSIVQSEADANDPDAKLIVQPLGPIASASGRTKALLALPSDLANGLHTLLIRDESWRLFVTSLRSGVKIAVGQKTSGRDEIARDDAMRTVIPFLVLLPILLLLIGVVIRGMLRPVAKLGVEVDTRSEDDLRPLSTGGVPSETIPFIESINRLLKRLNLAIESQKRFIADAAHELRTPMTALAIQAENLERIVENPAAVDRLAQLKSGLARFGRLLEQLLSLAHAQSQEASIAQIIPVVQLVRRALEDLMPLIDAKSIDISVDQPEGDSSVHMGETDGIAAVRNIIDNAIRYTPNGGPINIRIECAADVVKLEVVDSGPGIPSSELDRVLDPFYRSPGTKTARSGLGLAIVKSVLDRIGGTIILSNRIGGPGLRVLMVFPRIYDHPRMNQLRAQTPHRG